MSIWKVYAKKADFNGIGKKYGMDPVLARIIRNRDITDEQELDMYMHADLSRLHDSKKMKDMKKCVTILQKKIQEGSKIRIIGDYDIDGICSIYILYTGLKKCGAVVDYVIPHRITDGYGINEQLIKNAYSDGVDTIITCDNGIAAIPEIAYAKSLGMTMIVTDHHDIPYKDGEEGRQFLSSEADAIVNPKQIDCKYPFKVLCGAGVSYKVIQVLYEAMSLDDPDGMDELLAFAAIATVGDIVDLQGENRIIVKNGLKKIAQIHNKGLDALINQCGIDIEHISAYHIGFVIGPCLNASGRLDTAKRALEMLLESNSDEAAKKAGDLKALNDERKDMTLEETKKAIELVEKSDLQRDNVLVVYLPECHESIAGIIAGRLREHFYKPSIVLTKAEEGVKGSARSIDGYNMFEELNKCAYLLNKFGGHPMAAGMSLDEDKVDEFRRELNKVEEMTEEVLTPVSWIDVPMPVDYVTMDFVKQLSILEPFGKGNEKPVFADRNLTVRNSFLIGKNKNVLKMSLENERGFLAEAISFRVEQGQEIPERGDVISIMYYPGINEYNGRTSLQYIVMEYR